MLDPRKDPRQLNRARGSRQRRDAPAPSPSKSGQWLLGAVLVLLGLIAVSRLREPDADAVLPVAETAQALAPAPVPPVAPPPVARAPVPSAVAPPSTPTLDLMVRAEARRRIERAGSAVYLDSVLAESDSVLRRWPERPGQPVTVALVMDSLFDRAANGRDLIRTAIDRWTVLRLGVTFSLVSDTTNAELVVQWISQFDPEERRTGQTDLEMDGEGRIVRGRILLALRSATGQSLDRNAQLITAIHEVGHALGLGHSADTRDVMFPQPRVASLSARDQRTAQLIYGLPPTSIKQ